MNHQQLADQNKRESERDTLTLQLIGLFLFIGILWGIIDILIHWVKGY